jgi:ankyrin repeat protein
MKIDRYLAVGILVFVTLISPIRASESDLTKEFRKKVTHDTINSTKGYRAKHSQDGRSFFEAAIDEDDLGAINFLLERGADVDRPGSSGEPSLHYAIRNRRVDIVRKLLGAGADCNAGGIDNERPLMLAFKGPNRPDKQIILALFELHALRADEEDIYHNNSLHFAALCMGMSAEIVQKIIEHTSADKINTQNEQGNTALIIAICARNDEFVKKLLTCPKIDLSLCNTEGNSPLHMAAAIVKPALAQDLMQMLVEKADKDAINKKQENDPHDTALIIAIRCNNIGFVKALLTHPSKDKEHPFIDPNTADSTGKTPLHLAIEKESIECCQALLTHPHIAPNIADSTGETPLHLAIEIGNDELIRALLACKAIKRDIQDRYGNTPSHYAVVAGLPLSLREALLTHPVIAYNLAEAAHARGVPDIPLETKKKIIDGANLSLTNISGNCPIHLAVQRGLIDFDFLKALVVTTSGRDATHMFNNNGKLAYELSRNIDGRVTELVTPFLPTRLYFRSKDYLSAVHTASEEPIAVQFAPAEETVGQQVELATAAAPQQAEQDAAVQQAAQIQLIRQGLVAAGKYVGGKGVGYLADKIFPKK